MSSRFSESRQEVVDLITPAIGQPHAEKFVTGMSSYASKALLESWQQKQAHDRAIRFFEHAKQFFIINPDLKTKVSQPNNRKITNEVNQCQQ